MAPTAPHRDEDTGVIPVEDTAEWPAVRPELEPPAPPPRPAARRPPPVVGSPWPWLLLVAVAAGGILAWLLLARGGQHTVPRVVGLSQGAAVARLNDAGYDVTAVRLPSRSPAGRVLAQTPGAGARLDAGRTVTLRVSNGRRPLPRRAAKPKPVAAGGARTKQARVSMPGVVGRALADAGGTVEAAGLVADTEPVDSAAPSGTVVSQQPGAGAAVRAGSTVRLEVSHGRGAQPDVAVPDVAGLTAAAARARLWAAKLDVRTQYRHGNLGAVLGQQPGPGPAPAFSQVTLVVGR